MCIVLGFRSNRLIPNERVILLGGVRKYFWNYDGKRNDNSLAYLINISKVDIV